MATLDIIRTLCTKNGISIKKLEKELGFSNGSLAKSATIKAERLQKIAEFFGVSVDYLMTGEEQSNKVELNARDERDIAKDLNTYGIMSDLIRIKQGDYKIEDSYTIEQIENNEYEIIKLDSVLRDYYTVDMDQELEFKVKNGVVLNNIYNQEYVLFKSNTILALYKNENNKLKPFKMFL